VVNSKKEEKKEDNKKEKIPESLVF